MKNVIFDFSAHLFFTIIIERSFSFKKSSTFYSCKKLFFYENRKTNARSFRCFVFYSISVGSSFFTFCVWTVRARSSIFGTQNFATCHQFEMLFFRLTHSRFFCCKKSTNGSNEKFLFLERPVRKKCGQGTVLARFNAKTKPRTPIKFYKKKVHFEKVKKKERSAFFFFGKNERVFFAFPWGQSSKKNACRVSVNKVLYTRKLRSFFFFCFV